MIDPDDADFYEDDDYDETDCANCGGEGVVAHCFQEFACMHPDEGCDLCMRRCDWCAAVASKTEIGLQPSQAVKP